MTLEDVNTNVDERFKEDTWDFPIDILSVNAAEASIENKLKEAGWDPESTDVHRIKLGFREALINAIQHGNKNDPTKNIKVNIDINAETATITVCDQGEGFDSLKLQDPGVSEGLLKPSGRGVKYMKELLDEVKYEGKGNSVTMVKKRTE